MNQNLDGIILGNNNEHGFINPGNDAGSVGSSSVSFTTIEVSQLTTEFVIDRKYTIPSD